MAPALGVQLYTVREALAADRDATLRRIADIGFSYVEPFDPTDDPEGFRRVADDLGLRVISPHARVLLDADDPAPILEAVAALGADRVIIPAGIPADDFTTDEGIERAADRLNLVNEDVRRHGLSLGYHNHWWEFEPVFEGRHAIELLADRLASDVFLEVDTYWAALGGADVPALLGRLGERTELLHVKDGPLTGSDAPHVAVGEGAMPTREILAAAVAATPPHAPPVIPVIELDSCATDLFDALAASHAHVSGLGVA
ncbi:sugar phosphate isomerase/epimerase [Streptomyces sp. PT12]|uniref:sugar phosphate isomerase/epimerase family protein n=1 Tax=Streptomyces sp. PT12 TaxID=1510197 RepID=UPI000DE3195F|nr:sugar phosphate isomerase/epimerase [Streptomyces sp. PT12]RBM16144.1 sugar phosphate isomerase/epimerase [Streptomyces sp. PT12]